MRDNLKPWVDDLTEKREIRRCSKWDPCQRVAVYSMGNAKGFTDTQAFLSSARPGPATLPFPSPSQPPSPRHAGILMGILCNRRSVNRRLGVVDRPGFGYNATHKSNPVTNTGIGDGEGCNSTTSRSCHCVNRVDTELLLLRSVANNHFLFLRSLVV